MSEQSCNTGSMKKSADGNCYIDSEITLVPYFPNEDVTLAWYQDPDICRQADNIDHVYSLDDLRAMYGYLSTHGSCFYISYRGTFIGDISLWENSNSPEKRGASRGTCALIAIVICKEYQNRHIGRRCVEAMLTLARSLGYASVRANIYSFNAQSRRMFSSVGFREIAPEWYEFVL